MKSKIMLLTKFVFLLLLIGANTISAGLLDLLKNPFDKDSFAISRIETFSERDWHWVRIHFSKPLVRIFN